MKLTADQLYKKLVEEYKIIGEKGSINFTVKNLSILIKTKDTVGNLLQEWLKVWWLYRSDRATDFGQTVPL